MRKLFVDNWLISFYLLIIIFGISLSYVVPNLWIYQSSRKVFFKIGITIPLVLTTIWIYRNYKTLFQSSFFLRPLLIILGTCSVFVWAYKNTTAFEIEKIFIISCFIYLIFNFFLLKKVNFYKPNLIAFSIVAFIFLKFIGYFWNNDVEHRFADYETNTIALLLFVLIINLFFKSTHSEKLSFITICFKVFLGVLSINIIFYSFLVNTMNKPFFSFLTLDKSYLPYIEILQWGYFKHPSFIGWIILLMGGLGFLVWKENKKLISLKEIILYSSLLLAFAFMVQARIVIIGYLFTIVFFLWNFLTQKIKLKYKIVIISISLILGLLFVILLVTKTSYFSDPSRFHFYTISKELIHQNIWFGNGTLTQKNIAQQIHIEHKQLHNDFLSTMVDLGIVGVICLLSWVIISLWTGVSKRDTYLTYTILICLMIMNVDSLWYTIIGVYILFPILFFIFLPHFQEKEGVS